MLFAVRFTDHDHLAATRREHLDAHIEWIRQRRDRVLVAGSLRHEPADNPVGGLWIVEAPDKAAVQALLEDDPFWREGLRKSVEILHWSKALPEKTPV